MHYVPDKQDKNEQQPDMYPHQDGKSHTRSFMWFSRLFLVTELFKRYCCGDAMSMNDRLG
jgi:hypothetical protein